ncbi:MULTISPECIES: TetR/AcrR family transcriptional regulator [Paenibacillus]|uniref:TetR/AcrR family transcriptional regulator n=1 Tax=Paenibacillus TaxID=44249 RepID=UPI00020D6DB6|nr:MULTISPECIES: TetR/AcrR family transcriptional regulator [Paenibacillus]EGL16391.1 transcriptional regulator, TetR family [Paenibacillus sp. HGF7]EPD83870.1 hypothetical protein HMPREF1207_03234 [Paenibacillus sp. HGH0039]MBV6715993.1 TetR/AcrR family transcriptional regulator [Paenibacillus chitinolyticus]
MSIKNKLDPRVVRTRLMLRDALIALIGEQGYEKITVQDIANRAALNRATFYLHYRDKQDLMEQSMDDTLKELVDGLRPLFEDASEFRFDGGKPHPTFVWLFEEIARHAQFYRVVLGEQRMPYFTRGLTDVITGFVTKGVGTIAPEERQLAVPREMLVSYVVSAILGVILWWLQSGMPYTASYMAEKLMRLATRGPYVDDPFTGAKE